MKERPILMSAPMVRAILDGRKTQTRRLVTSVRGHGLGRVAEFQATTTPGYDFIMRGPRGLWNDLKIADLLSRCPHGVPGDRLWVRETWAPFYANGHSTLAVSSQLSPSDANAVRYAATPDIVVAYPSRVGTTMSWESQPFDAPHRWCPSIHMPRWASRITLEVTEVRVQRLQDITEEDALAEGLSRLSKDGGQTWKWGIPDRDGLWGTDDDGWPWSDWDVDPRKAYATLWDRINGAGSWSANPWVWAISFTRVGG